MGSWERGTVIGNVEWASQLATDLASTADTWTVVREAADADIATAEVVVSLAALTAGGADANQRLADAVLDGDPRPRRVVFVVTDGWLGVTGSIREAARSATTVATTRALALRLAAHGTAVNAVSVSDGFPGDTPKTAPIRTTVGLADLAHTVSFFIHPLNGYVTGQVLSISGGDSVWANLSA
jgi:hypothetical protein